MRRTTKAEFQMLRELAHIILPKLKCYFCHQHIMLQQETDFGHRRHGPVEARLTWHHLDEDRDNNIFVLADLTAGPGYTYQGNLVPSHTFCHKSHHGKLSAAEVNES